MLCQSNFSQILNICFKPSNRISMKLQQTSLLLFSGFYAPVDEIFWLIFVKQSFKVKSVWSVRASNFTTKRRVILVGGIEQIKCSNDHNKIEKS